MLGGTLPNVISISFNACASRRILQATVGDLIVAMDEAKPLPVLTLEEWEEARDGIIKAAKRNSFASAKPRPLSRQTSGVPATVTEGSATQGQQHGSLRLAPAAPEG